MEPFKRITFIFAAYAFCVVLADPIFGIYLTGKGYDPAWLSIILSSFSLTMIAAAPLIGGISDNWGRRPLVLFGIGAEIIALLTYAMFTHPLIIFLARVLEACAYASVIFVAIAKMEDIVAERKETKLGEKIGKSLSIGKIGFVLGPVVGAFIATKWGLTAPFYVGAGLLVMLGIWYLFEKHHIHPKPPLEKLEFNLIPRFREYLKNPPLRGLAFVEVAHQTSMPVLFVFFPLFLVQDLGLSIELVGIAILVREIPMLLQFWTGKITDSWGSRKSILIGSSLAGIAMIGLSQAHTFDAVLVASFLFGAGTSLLGISSLSLISGIAEKTKQEGTFLGTQVGISKGGAFVSYILIGVLVEITSIPTALLTIGAIILLGVIIGENDLGYKTFPLPSPKRLVSGLFHHR
ncbi:MAG: MFS transporter [Candidatus Diapherotrites archaeon]